MHDQRSTRRRGGKEEGNPAADEREAEQNEQGEICPALHWTRAPSARPISSSSDVPSGDGSRTSASSRSRSAVSGWVTATQNSTAAFAARMRLVASSKAMVPTRD